MPTSRLIYYSENQLDPNDGSVVRQLSSILSAANRNNRQQGLTGALVFDDLWFLQILEGPRQNVWDLFKRIGDDERHTTVVLAEMIDVQTRIFGNWWMGLATRSTRSEAVFARFLEQGKFDPRQMSAAQMLSLAVELAKLGLHRELTETAPAMSAYP